MWCRRCNMETNGKVCPVCGAETIEDLPTEIFWCKECRSPVIYNTNAADKGICPICRKKTRYMAQDLRPVFPEERLLMAVLLNRDPDEFMREPIYIKGNGFSILYKGIFSRHYCNLFFDQLNFPNISKIYRFGKEFSQKLFSSIVCYGKHWKIKCIIKKS